MKDKEFAALLARVETELDKRERNNQGAVAMYCMVQVIAPELTIDQVTGLVNLAEDYKKRARERELQSGA